MVKRIAVTGTSGFTGRTLLNGLKRSGYELLPLVRRSSCIQNEVVLDLGDPKIGTLLKKLPPVDSVVHLGARIGWDTVDRSQLFRPNVMATGELAEWAAGCGAHFIYLSAALIAGENQTLISHGDPPGTGNDYLISKWLGEEMIRMSGVRYCILRSAGIFGYDGPGHLGLNRCIKGAINGDVPVLSVNPRIKRNYIYVKDLCRMIQFCLEEQPTGTFLVAGSDINTMGEMLQALCDVFLPGTQPVTEKSFGGFHQVVKSTEAMPPGRSFLDSIKDIRSDLRGKK